MFTIEDADPDPNPQRDMYFIPHRHALSITTDIGLPATFDTLYQIFCRNLKTVFTIIPHFITGRMWDKIYFECLRDNPEAYIYLILN